MEAGEVLSQVEFAVLDAVHRSASVRRCGACSIPSLRGRPAGQAVVHDALRRCEQAGLLRSARNASGRRYELTAAGRARLRADRRFRHALARVLARSL